MDGSEADGNLVLIQTFLLYYINQVIFMLTSIFQGQFPWGGVGERGCRARFMGIIIEI